MDGEQLAALCKDIEYIKEDVGEIRVALAQLSATMQQSIDRQDERLRQVEMNAAVQSAIWNAHDQEHRQLAGQIKRNDVLNSIVAVVAGIAATLFGLNR